MDLMNFTLQTHHTLFTVLYHLMKINVATKEKKILVKYQDRLYKTGKCIKKNILTGKTKHRLLKK